MQPSVPAVYDLGQAVLVALAGALALALAFIPKLLGALAILLVGWLVSRLVSALVTRGLRLIRFNQVADRAEIDQFLARAGVQLDPAAAIGKLVYWFLMLIFVVAAFGAFGLTQVAVVLNQIIAFIPNVVVALVVLLLGALAANFTGNLVRGAIGTAHVGDPRLMATLARAAVMVFATLIALSQLQIAPAIVDTLWIALVGMVALAGGLAFGLGGRDVARQILEDVYNRSRAAAGATSGLEAPALPNPAYTSSSVRSRARSTAAPGANTSAAAPDTSRDTARRAA